MKMRNIISHAVDGQIKKIHIKKGDIVSKNQLLVEFE
jgi:biotin carboxyl carrier protein